MKKLILMITLTVVLSINLKAQEHKLQFQGSTIDLINKGDLIIKVDNDSLIQKGFVHLRSLVKLLAKSNKKFLFCDMYVKTPNALYYSNYTFKQKFKPRKG